jgi:hypothetical protein
VEIPLLSHNHTYAVWVLNAVIFHGTVCGNGQTLLIGHDSPSFVRNGIDAC